MKVAVIFNKDQSGVINVFGMQNREVYKPQTVERVASALEKGGHNVRVIDGNINVIESLKDFMPRVVHGEQPGMVFNMAYGIQGVSRYTHIPSLLEMVGIPYVGSSPSGHGIALDKVTSKVLFQANGVPTAEYWVFSSVDQIPENLPFPLIVKPKMEAVSLGIQVVQDFQALKAAVASLMEEFKQQVLVEEFIPGREFAVGLLGNRDPEVLPIVEIDFGGDEMAIQSLDDKTRNPRGKLCPAPVDELLKENLGKTAKAAFRALGVYDFSRVDFRLDKNGNLYVLELNSMASLGSSGSYVTSAKAAGYTFESLINRMLDVAVERYFGKQSMEQLAAPEPLLTSLFKRTTTPLHVRIRSYLRGNLGTMEDFLATMVDINSYVHNIEGVNSLGRWVSNQLANLGFQRLVHPRAEFGNMIYFSNHEGEKNDVLIVGHLDNPVHYQDYSSFLEERGRIYGTGVAWGKGGIAVLLGALSALRYTRSLKKVKCGILFITDDSLGGRSSRPLIEELSRNSHYVIGLRGAGLSGELITSCSGTMNFNIEINQVPPRPGRKEGTETHDPVLFAAEKILSLKKLAAQNKGVECTITSVHTRGTGQLPPDYTNLSFLFRFSDTAQSERLETQVNRIFKEGTPGNIKVHLTRGPSRRPFPETEEIRNFYEKVERLARLIEVRVQKTHSPVHSFLSFVPQEIPVLDGLGPVTGGIGGNNEYVIKDSLLDRAVLLANVIFLSNRNFNL